MRSALTLLVISIGQVALAALYPQAAWLLGWSSLSFGVVAAAYVLHKPGVFGKRRDGTLAWGPCVLLLPYLLLTWLFWYCQTRFSRESVCDEVAPGLWLGRRAALEELPQGVTLIVDLTSEFSEPRTVRTGRAYPFACRHWTMRPLTEKRSRRWFGRWRPGRAGFTSTAPWGTDGRHWWLPPSSRRVGWRAARKRRSRG